MSEPSPDAPAAPHYAVRLNGVGQPVDLWLCEPGAQPATIGADLVLADDPRAGDAGAVLVQDAGGGVRVRNAGEQLEVARAAKLAELSAKRKAVLNGTFAFGGHRIQCNADARQDFSEQNDAIAMGIPGALPQQWRTADNAYVPIPDASVWGTFLGAYAAHKQATWTAFYAHETALAAHADPASYDITTGWPA